MPDEPRWKKRLANNREARKWNLTSLLLSLPLLLNGYYYYGGRALRLAAISIGAAVLTEFVAGRLILKRRTVDDFNAVVVGLWIACMLPASTLPLNGAPLDVGTALFQDKAPLYAIAGSMFAVLVAKIPFGGAANVPFSPAAAGFAFLTVCFPARVFAYVPSVLAPPAHSHSIASMLQHGRSVTEGQISNILLGQTAGPMGTGGILVLAVALLAMFLLKERRGYACASLGFVLAVALLAFAAPRVMLPAGTPFAGTLGTRMASVFMELCSGSLLFAAVFLLPEPSIMPVRWYTRLAMGAAAGALCMLLRWLGSYEENVCFAILLANGLLPALYRIQSEMHHQKEFRQTHEDARGALF